MLNNHEELVQLLLDRGADASVKNEVGRLAPSARLCRGRERTHGHCRLCSSLRQFGKGVLDMARVFDRQVGCFPVPAGSPAVQPTPVTSPVLLHPERGLLVGRKEKEADAEEFRCPFCPLTRPPLLSERQVQKERDR